MVAGTYAGFVREHDPGPFSFGFFLDFTVLVGEPAVDIALPTLERPELGLLWSELETAHGTAHRIATDRDAETLV